VKSAGLVLRQGSIDGFRAFQMIQDKAQSAGNGQPFSRAATRSWIIWKAPCGRAVKRSSAALRLLARASHSRRGAPCGQPFHDSLNPSILPCRSTSLLDITVTQSTFSCCGPVYVAVRKVLVWSHSNEVVSISYAQ
jgi:hypothetical protein